MDAQASTSCTLKVEWNLFTVRVTPSTTIATTATTPTAAAPTTAYSNGVKVDALKDSELSSMAVILTETYIGDEGSAALPMELQSA